MRSPLRWPSGAATRDTIILVNLSGPRRQGHGERGQAAEAGGRAVSRYAQMFERLKQRNEGAFGAFLMLGDPDKQTSAALLDTVVEAARTWSRSAYPVSDPVADGPVIQLRPSGRWRPARGWTTAST
jgi:hypothetical protein